MKGLFSRLKKWFLSQLEATVKVDLVRAKYPAEHDGDETVVPYDENLLERSRTQWQFGDWDSLAEIPRDTLQHHPDRAKLALLVAAGHVQQGKNQQARQFARLAQDWGCSKKLISQILISGVYNSLGRAAAVTGHKTRSLHHFGAALAIGDPGSDQRLLAQARLNEQHKQLGLEANSVNAKVVVDDTRAIAQIAISLPSRGVEELGQTLKEQKEDLDKQLKKQTNDLISVRKFLDSSLKKEVANATKQIEAAMGLQSYFATGELPNINTERHNWPISPDFSLYLVELLELNDYDLIIEFGSGISTVIVAKTLAKMAARRVGKPAVGFASFDHLEQYYQQTCGLLRQAGLTHAVQLCLAQLQDWQAPDGNSQPYYACEPTLAALARAHPPTAALRLLVIVDGPPGATSRHARYPAGPLVLDHFAGAQIDLLLDDYLRDDEKEIAKRWQADIAKAQLSQTTTERKLEKDACLIAIQPAINRAPA